MKRLGALLLSFLFLTPAGAQTALSEVQPAPAGPPMLSAGTAVSEMRIDGRLDEAAWAGAEVATGFTQNRPNAGEPSTQRTEARVLFGRDAVYVGMRMYETSRSDIVTRLGRRDAGDLQSDWAHVLFDSYHDRRTGFRFSVNPSGVKVDALHFDDTNSDDGWDAVWEVSTSVDDEGWTAEFRIPLSQLRYRARSTADEAVWGVNFGREIARLDELSLWAPIPRDADAGVSLAGELRGLPALPAMRRLEVLPYSLGRVTRAPVEPDNPFHDATALWSSMGADVRYGLTSDLTVSATVNPDFGQVEADPSEVNLSTFETFLQERRPFFQEGSDVFRIGIGLSDSEQIFYSRRIGRAPQRNPYVAGAHVDVPEAARILAAAKVTGKVGRDWSIGALNATTGAVHARVDSDGRRWEEPAEPLSNYAVVRATRAYDDGRSTVGGIITAANRDVSDPALKFLNSAGYVGGADLRHRFGNGDYRLNAMLLGSRIEGSEEAIVRVQRSSARYFQRPDAEHVRLDPSRTSLGGYSAVVHLMKSGGGNWRGGLIYQARSPGFEVNDLGFQTEADHRVGVAYAGFEQYEARGPFRDFSIYTNAWNGYSFGGERLSLGGNVNGNFQLHSQWRGGAAINWNGESLNPFHLRGGPAIVRPARTSASVWLNTDRRRPVSGYVRLQASEESGTEGSNTGVSVGATVRASSSFDLGLHPSMSWSTVSAQCATPPSCRVNDHYLFARMDQRTAALTARVNYTFSPSISLQLYAQPYISAGRFGPFREVVEPRASRFDDRFHTFTEQEVARDASSGWYRIRHAAGHTLDFEDPAFRFAQLRSNAVFRWEYRPGSTLFVVWSHGRTAAGDDGTFRLGDDSAELFRAPATNVLMVKLNYWLNL
jgi:hypothetical protein